MQLHDETRIRHIIDSCKEIEEILNNIEKDAFLEDRMIQLSVVKLIEIIGEASNHLSNETREISSDIPWIDIIGMRNRLIHGYFDMDLEIVWITATQEVPDLLLKLKSNFKDELDL